MEGDMGSFLRGTFTAAVALALALALALSSFASHAAAAGGSSSKKSAQTVKGSEHTSNQSPSNKQKHEDGQAAKQLNAEVRAFKDYKNRGGNMAKSAWKKAGQPAKD
jgi:ABC-type oligopeptide transport system substrate-binding subunit